MTALTGAYSLFDAQANASAPLVGDAYAPASRTAPAQTLSALDVAASVVNGTIARNQPQTIRALSFNAGFAKAFFDDFYNRIHITPTTVDFGSVSVTTAATVAVWNAYLVNRTVTSYAGASVEQGVSITRNGSALYRPLQQQTFTVTANALGSATIGVNFTLNFDTPETFVVPVSGVRAVLSPFMPNWASPYRVTREFRTTIQTSRSGKEQRRALRNRPRKKIEYSVMVAGSTAMTFNRIMKSFAGRDIQVADESRSVASTVDMAAGSLSMTLASAPSWLTGQVALRYLNTTGTATVQSVTGNVVTFTTASGTWPAGTKVFPILSGRILEGKLNTKLVTDAAQTADITLIVNPLSEPEIDPPAASFMWNGREVVLAKPNWSQAPDITFSNAFETVDFGFGAIDHFNPIAYTSRAQRATYLNMSAAQMEALENVFIRAKGQRGEFYMPSWQNDLPLYAPVAAGNNSFLVAGTEVCTYFKDDTVFKDICICYSDDTYQCAQVQTIYVDSGNSVVQCTQPFGRSLDSSVTMICWMPVHRFMSDALTTEWITDSVAQSQLSVISLEDLTPEG